MVATLSSAKKRIDPRGVTTIIGTHCKHGLLLFSDTTETLGDKAQLITTKNDYVTKIHYITGNYAIGCSGSSSAKINALYNYLRDQIPEGSPLLSRTELYSLLYDKLIPSFCAKERKIVEMIYGDETNIRREIDIQALFAARLKDNSHILYKINIFVAHYHQSPKEDRTDIHEVKFGAVGSGSEAIEPILNQTMRLIEKKGYSFTNWSRKLASLYCHLLMKFAFNSDAKTGYRFMGAFIRGSSKDFPENPSTWIQQKDYLVSNAWQELIVQALVEMPNFVKEIPIEKLGFLFGSSTSRSD